ncbi:MAG TPA: hypothetical protein VL400_11575 [Polyangiaceae bacterium]|jgi:hypothetical protein|nr:hypothetical protein [Polyangiaceae bacterium]
MPNWRDELLDAVKTKNEREAEEAAKQRQRVLEALTSAEEALKLGVAALEFVKDRIAEKGQNVTLTRDPPPAEGTEGGGRLVLGAHSIGVELDRTTAILKVTFLEGKPREFDFARDRHIAPSDVEEYVGRRAVELVKNAQKAAPW